MNIGEILADQLEGTRDWTRRLLADIAGDEWAFQPQPGLAHPLWICGHLAFAENGLIHVRCAGESQIEDAFTAHFKMGSAPSALGEQKFPSPEEVMRVMEDVHTKALAVVQAMTPTELAESAGAAHPHFDDKLGAVSHCMRHEAFHAGQLALIRRLMGKPALR